MTWVDSLHSFTKLTSKRPFRNQLEIGGDDGGGGGNELLFDGHFSDSEPARSRFELLMFPRRK